MDILTEIPTDLTPVQKKDVFWVKRDDLFTIAGVRGGKVRSCWHLAQGAKGVVTAGSRSSPQVNIVASIAQELGIPCHCHIPMGPLLPEVAIAKSKGAKIIQHKAGYNSVIVARAREDAKATGFKEIPFGMECIEAVEQTQGQVKNIPNTVDRIVMPVGSAMSLCGVIRGLEALGRRTPVLGIIVGADPQKRVSRFCPDYQNLKFEKSKLDYHEPVADCMSMFQGIMLDPIYEAKCKPFLRAGDCLWIVGVRESAVPHCQASIDGECGWVRCPQVRDREPAYSGRHCPLDVEYPTL